MHRGSLLARGRKLNAITTKAIHAAALSTGLAWWCIAPLRAAPITWIGGDGTWTDGTGNNSNWNPADEPDPDDTAIFNSANVVNLGSNNSVLGLTMSGSIDLHTNGFSLAVDGLVQLSGTSTNLIIGGSTGQVLADSVTINSGAMVELDGGSLTINEESGNGLLDINTGGLLAGHGVVFMTDAVAANTTLIVNDGTITARRAPLTLFGAPQVGILSINATDADTRIDLDGAGELGVVNVTRNQTLDINIPLADAFGGTMLLTQNATLDMSSAWTLNGGVINADNGFIDNPIPLPDVPAGTATIAGGALTQTGGTINVVDTDGTLRFQAPFTMSGGNFVNNGLVVFDANATIGASANFTMPTTTSSLTVAAGRSVIINQNNFNLDGSNTATNVITVNEGGVLTINITDYDPDSATNSFDGVITVNSGSIDVTTSDAEFVMDGTLNMNKSGGPVAEWSGEPLDIGNDAGVLDADLNVGGSGNSIFNVAVDFNSDADVAIAATNGLIFNQIVNFDTVNGVNNAEFTGAGAIRFNASANFNEAVTFNMPGGTVDFDGLDTFNGDTINIDAPVTVNAATMDSFGKVNSAGANTLDINNSAGTGVLTVNLDDPNAEWTLNAAGVMNLVNDNTEATLLAGSDVNINGTVNVTGDVRTTARLDMAGTITINTAGQPFRLGGGNAGPDVNTISGATISGLGLLGADTGKVLHGFGTINANIDFDGTASLRASGGMLTLGGAIVDVNILGTADDTGILNIVNPWETDGGAGGSIGAVVLGGGVLQGGQITNDNINGLQGHGTITARVINSSKIVAANGGTLLLQTAANDNDWDGATNTGELQALSANLELRDNSTFGFTGRVRAINNNQVFANGFALDFNPGSTLELEGTARYRSTSSTDIGGTVTIGAGANATIQVTNNFFLTFETGSNTTLNGDLTLVNNNINIEQGATFSGPGALIIPKGSHLVADNQADIGVLLDMKGAFRPGNFDGVGRVQLLDMQLQSGTFNGVNYENGSELFVELTGTALNQFDRLVLSGDGVIGGYLNIDIDAVSPGVPFVPSLGQTFNIITGNTITGTFDYADVSGMPAGLAFHVAYLPNAVQLQVVPKPFFSADFDDDGDVDWTDLAIWRGAYDLNQLGDANGDNITDLRDWTIWRDQFAMGAKPGPAPFSVPEPGVCGLLALGGLGALRRRIRRTATSLKAGLICALALALPSAVDAMPTMTVVANGGGQFVVKVASDPGLGGQALAVQLAFDVLGTNVGTFTVDTANFPFVLPGDNPFTDSTTHGVQVNFATDQIFVSLGSNLLTPGVLMNVGTITTGAGPTIVSWGGHLIDHPATTPQYIGSRIAQNGQYFDGYQGSVNSPGALLGDFEPDGDLDAADIDMLFDAVQGPVPPALAKFDLNSDNQVITTVNAPASDSDVWVKTLKHTEYGDANLDGKVDVADLGTLASNWQGAGTWATADFDGSGFIDVNDLGLLASNWQFGVNSAPGPTAGPWAFAEALASVGLASTSVPEPATAATGVVLLVLLGHRRRMV